MNASLHFFAYGLEIKIESGTIILYKKKVSVGGSNIMTFMEILEKNVNNWHKRIFLESWHSTIDKNAVNERKPFPSVYKTLLKP